MPSNRVLLAHRDPAVQELAERALSRTTASLDIADDSADALLRIAREPYGVIVIERDDEMISAIADQYPGRHPIVIVTAEDGRDLDPNIVSLVVPEPYDPQMLIGVILACVTPEVPPVPSESPLPVERGEG